MSTLLTKPFWGLAADVNPEPAWVWDGYLAAGKTTLLTSLWKSGKTTLVSLVLSRRGQGGAVAGRTVKPGVSVVISEEGKDLWQGRCRRLSFGERVIFYCQPFGGRATAGAWRDLLDELLALHREFGVDLVVIDTVATLLPWCDENNAIVVREALDPLGRLTEAGIALWLLHHPRKAEAAPGMAARGSGAMPATADVVLEMRHPGGDPGTRRRRLFGFSRFEATPRVTLMELNEGGTDYQVLDGAADEFTGRWRKLEAVLAQADEPLKRREILAIWPADEAPPSDSALYRWLTKAEELGLVIHRGTGGRYDPHCYQLADAARPDTGLAFERVLSHNVGQS
jgi:hypothetical protein